MKCEYKHIPDLSKEVNYITNHHWFYICLHCDKFIERIFTFPVWVEYEL